MSRRPDGRPLRRTLRATLGALVLGWVPTAAPAQSLGPDPYQPYNSMYKPFVYPTAPPSGGIPNMGRLDAIGSAPSPSRGFAGYLDSLGMGTPDPFQASRGNQSSRGNVSRFTPYYRSYRQFDNEFQRQTGPTASDDFYRDQDERHRRYIEALRERDPKKRQAMLKEIETDNRNAIRASSDPGRFRTYRESRQTADPAAPAGNRGAATNANAAQNRRAGPTDAELDALPDPGPLPPDPNRASRRVNPALPDDLDNDPALAPSRVLERSRSIDQRRPRRRLMDLPALPGEEGVEGAPSQADRAPMPDVGGPEPAPEGLLEQPIPLPPR